MTILEFNEAIGQLQMAYNKKLEPDQNKYWFEKFKDWPAFKFGRAIDLCIEASDRFPSIAAILRHGNTLTDHSAPSGPVSNCNQCHGKGHVTALREGYRFTFRCDKCSNWEGRYSESIPMWQMLYHIEGYSLDL